MADVLMAVIMERPWSMLSHSLDDSREHLGRVLIDRGRFGPADLCRWFTGVMRDRVRRSLEHLNHGQDVAPEYWVNASTIYRRRLVTESARTSFVVPVEYAGCETHDLAWIQVSSSLLEYGELLVGWPLMWEAAADMNRRRM